jgi:hypothetical protein
LEKFIGTKVETPNGKAIISKFYFTELGYLMIKLYFIDEKRWVNYRIGELNNLLQVINTKVENE